MNDLELEQKINMINNLVDESTDDTIMMKETAYLIYPSSPDIKPYYDTTNMTGMYSKLIRDCGRFTESYNSDLIIGINKIEKAITKLSEINMDNPFDSDDKGKPSYHWFGIRTQGVDHDNYIVNRICQRDDDIGYFEYYYPRIYCIKLQPENDGKTLMITMHNMKQKIISAIFRKQFSESRNN